LPSTSFPRSIPAILREQTQAAGTGLNGGAMGADGLPFSATVGWDWIPGIRDRDMGIWEKVRLTSTGPVTVEDPYVVTNKVSAKPDLATIVLQASFHKPHGSSHQGQSLLSRSMAPYRSYRFPTRLRRRNFPPSIRPHRYPSAEGFVAERIRRKISTNSPPPSSPTADVPTIKPRTSAIRTIKYFPEGGAHDLTVIVNGVPIFCKGGNWGMDEAMKRRPSKPPRSADAAAQGRELHDDSATGRHGNQVDFYDMCDQVRNPREVRVLVQPHLRFEAASRASASLPRPCPNSRPLQKDRDAVDDDGQVMGAALGEVLDGADAEVRGLIVGTSAVGDGRRR